MSIPGLRNSVLHEARYCPGTTRGKRASRALVSRACNSDLSDAPALISLLKETDG